MSLVKHDRAADASSQSFLNVIGILWRRITARIESCGRRCGVGMGQVQPWNRPGTTPKSGWISGEGVAEVVYDGLYLPLVKNRFAGYSTMG